MKVRQLRHMLKSLPGDMEIVTVGGSDHSYIKLCCAGTRNAEEFEGEYYEYYDDRNMSEGGKKVKVLVLD